MRQYAVLVLTVSAVFLLIVGAFLNTRSLFFMSTVMIVTLLSLRVQAELATRGLRFERIAPLVMVAGERVAMRIRVWSTLRIRRPLLFIFDDLPPQLEFDPDTRPLPIAPSYEQAVETRYELSPLKRGVYRWQRIVVASTDSLGLITVHRLYETDPIEVTIHPAKIPVSMDVAALSGWGANQADEGRSSGDGMEPRGVREFVPGDSLRHVHWRSTARTGKLQVKEFETGFNARVLIAQQLTEGSEAGAGTATTLEAMCGHAAFFADTLLQRGSTVELPLLEEASPVRSSSVAQRYRAICDALARATATSHQRFASQLDSVGEKAQGSVVIVMLTVAEEGVAAAVRRLAVRNRVLVLLYDPDLYSKEKLVINFLSCTDPDFMAALAMPNVTLRVMPYPYGIEA